MDALLLLLIILSIIIYLALFRLFFARKNLKTMLLSIVFYVVAISIIAYGIAPYPTMLPRIGLALLSAVSIGIVLVSFLLSAYSYVESSITIKLFSLIAGAGEKGISKSQVFHIYNKDVIVQRRISRLTAEGIIRKKNGRYSLIPGASPFSFRNSVFTIFQWVYGK